MLPKKSSYQRFQAFIKHDLENENGIRKMFQMPPLTREKHLIILQRNLQKQYWLEAQPPEVKQNIGELDSFKEYVNTKIAAAKSQPHVHGGSRSHPLPNHFAQNSNTANESTMMHNGLGRSTGRLAMAAARWKIEPERCELLAYNLHPQGWVPPWKRPSGDDA